MGARGYIAFDFEGGRRIVLSTHWDGRALGTMLQAALRAWPSYQGEGKLADLVYQEMTRADDDGGNSISPWAPGDADFGGFVIEVETRTIRQTAPNSDETVQQWSVDAFDHVPESEFTEAWSCA